MANTFRYEQFSNPLAGTLAELLARANDPQARAAERIGDAQARAAASIGDAQARATQQSGNAWAGAVQNIGQTLAAIPGQIQQQKVDTQRQQAGALELEARKRTSEATKTLATVMQQTPKLNEDGVSVWDVPAITKTMADSGFGPEAGAAAQHLQGINDAFRQANQARLAIVQRGAQAVAGAGNDPALANHFLDQMEANKFLQPADVAQYRQIVESGPEGVAKLTAYLAGPQKPVSVGADSRLVDPLTNKVVLDAQPKPGEGDYTINDQRFAANGTPIGAPAPPKAPATPPVQPRDNRPIDVQAAEALMKGDTAGYQRLLQVKKEMSRADDKPAAPPAEKAGIWIVRQGQTLRVQEKDIRPGDLPASTREQGRPVTSGDAGRIAELVTSMDDLEKLKNTLGTTGAASKVGAMLPNAVTEFTGWGADAKSRQGTIDRVKQVIGKALEGGVLRKEDEIKYEKILPTIGDPPSVAKSKLEGLQAAIALRRERTIEALQDAGYDVSKFGARQPTAPAAPVNPFRKK